MDSAEPAQRQGEQPGEGAALQPEREGDEAAVDPRLLPYDYSLPDDLIARWPAERREDARLLVLRGAADLDMRRAAELPELLEPGDLLVVNDTAVMPARLQLRRATGGAVEALLLAPGPGPVPAMMRPAGKLRPGERLEVLGAPAELGAAVVTRARLPGGDWEVDALPDPMTLMTLAGRVPLPPYLGRADTALDRERYQTVYAGPSGAVAAPTAGLHLSEGLLASLARRGVGLARVTLHVGPGTFRNLRPEDLDEGRLHPEPYWIPEETARLVASTRARGGRIVAVGTTSVRALESAASGGELRAGGGTTRLFIREGYRFSVVDRLLTNFHLPRSSLLMLVSAFGGRARVLAAYERAVRERLRFYSYGDAMLLDRAGP